MSQSLVFQLPDNMTHNMYTKYVHNIWDNMYTNMHSHMINYFIVSLQLLND